MNKLPKHVAIVMDGNGRWATQRNLPRIAGHRVGAKAVREAIKFATEADIQVLTLFAFSSENWNRPAAEVNFLMDLFLKTLRRETKKLHKHNVHLRIIGDYAKFDLDLQKKILEAQELTANNTGLTLVIAANYSGRWDLTQAMQQIAQLVKINVINTADITTDLVNQYLCLADLPEPDLLIRTSGELRISNFMLWQFAYTELFFTDVLWPDFNAAIFQQALTDFAQRQRRYGLTGKQISDEQFTEA